jgi:MFS family permease
MYVHVMGRDTAAPVETPPGRRPSRLPSTVASFSDHNFRLFWFGGLVSQTGTWMQMIAQPWLVLEITHSPIAVGTVGALQSLPVLCLALFAGVMTDRFPKHKLMLLTQSLSLVQAVILATLTLSGRVQLWHIYVLALSLGVFTAFDNPTRQSFVVELVGRERTVNAIGLNSAMINGARLLGPAIGGLVISTVGVGVCFVFNAVSYVAMLVALLLLRSGELKGVRVVKQDGRRILGELGEAMRFVFSVPELVVVVIALGGLGTFGYNFNTVIPLLAEGALHVDGVAFGLLTTAFGTGSVIGALTTATSGRASQRKLLLGAASFSLVFMGVGLAPYYSVAMALLLVLGYCGMTFATSANSSLQLQAPDRLRGRVMGLYTLLMAGTTPIGSLLAGFLTSVIGIRLAIVCEACGCLLAVAIALIVRARATARPISSQVAAA